MLGKLLPLLLALAGAGAGVGAGLALRPDTAAIEAQPEEPACPPDAGHGPPVALGPDGGHGEAGAEHAFVKLNNQFVVPVVEKGRVASLVVLSVTLEVATGQTEQVYDREPKIRDALLQVLFDHANSGGFSGPFTDSTRMAVLRKMMREAAVQVLGPVVFDVLITDIVRQDG